jgi:DNA-directed RNA polymerase subunit beta'
MTASLKDIKVDTKIRDAVFKKADQQVVTLRKSHKPGLELDNKIAQVYEDAAKESFGHIKEQLKKQDSNFYHMIASGAAKKASQLQQMVAAPGIVMDAKDRKIPVPIRKSYAEGVTTADYFMSTYGVRKGMMDRALQTAKPGEMNKDIMAAVVDNVVTTKDCGTMKGISLPISSSDVYGRLLASDQGGFHRNDAVTPQMISTLGKKGVKMLSVRSPLRCIAPKGTCAHCFGHNEHGHLPEVGDNIGASAGQTMSEPATQMTMRTFHSGGVSTGAPQASGFERINQLLKMPKYVASEAALAAADGKVTKIGKSPAGGVIVHVGDHEHISAPGLTASVKVGDTVKRGDALTNGVLKPQELLKYKGMRAAQDYIVDELKKTYESQGVPIHRKIFETVIRSVANGTRVIAAPGHTDFVPGDVIPFTTAVHYNETRKLDVPADEAVGYHLTEAVGKLPAFHEVTEKDVPYLRAMGYNRLHVVKEPLVHSPLLKSVVDVPMFRKDWMAQLGYRYIKKGLTEGAAQGWKSNVEGTHPVPAFAYGASFGKKKETY